MFMCVCVCARARACVCVYSRAHAHAHAHVHACIYALGAVVYADCYDDCAPPFGHVHSAGAPTCFAPTQAFRSAWMSQVGHRY